VAHGEEDIVATPKKASKTDRVARDRVRAYEARQEVHTHIIARRKRDNIIAVVAVVLISAITVGAQLLHVAITPATPTATPTAEPEAQNVPDISLSEGRTWSGTLTLNDISLQVELDGALAPQAVASTISLATSGFYNNVPCHRLTTAGIYVLQCGDPQGDGTGGPGYSYGPVENAPADNVYPAGTIAMARQSGNGSSQGSQFFIVYADSTIPSDAAGGYTVVGRVTSGLGSLQEAVVEAGVQDGGNDGKPVVDVKITGFSLQ
jgi:peptidyl-prolyl cis-trans isomerase B (cyclophilin B)